MQSARESRRHPPFVSDVPNVSMLRPPSTGVLSSDWNAPAAIACFTVPPSKRIKRETRRLRESREYLGEERFREVTSGGIAVRDGGQLPEVSVKISIRTARAGVKSERSCELPDAPDISVVGVDHADERSVDDGRSSSAPDGGEGEHSRRFDSSNAQLQGPPGAAVGIAPPAVGIAPPLLVGGMSIDPASRARLPRTSGRGLLPDRDPHPSRQTLFQPSPTGSDGLQAPADGAENSVPPKVGRVVRTCEHHECPRRPSFGFPGCRQASFCKSHRLKGQVDVTSRRCEREGCNLIPSFKHKEDKGARFCSAHKLPGMQDFHRATRYCKDGVGCTHNPSFGFRGGKRTSCSKHKQIGMINLNTSKCHEPGCDVNPHFALPGSAPRMCSTHRWQGMVNVVSKRCEEASCDRIPSYGLDEAGAKAAFCKSHKAEGMVNVRHPRCRHSGCRHQPGFGKAGGKEAVYCREHMEAGMVDVKNNYSKKRRA